MERHLFEPKAFHASCSLSIGGRAILACLTTCFDKLDGWSSLIKAV